MSSSEEKRETAPTTRIRSLKEALDVARNKAAEQTDALLDLKAAEHARLAALAEELRPMMQEIDESDERFDFCLANGERPRLWIDMTSFVAMGRDQQTYRFLKDTRLGRIVLAETADMDRMADIISDYVVDKVLERERVMEGEREYLRVPHTPIKNSEDALKDQHSQQSYVQSPRKSGVWRKFWWFLLGILCGLIIVGLGTIIWSTQAH